MERLDDEIDNLDVKEADDVLHISVKVYRFNDIHNKEILYINFDIMNGYIFDGGIILDAQDV